MKLYHCHNARSMRPLWALEELGLDYELVTMPFPPRAGYPNYLSINPLGTVPTFVDGDLTMTESAGICHFLAERHAPNLLRVDPSEPAYGDYLNWLYRSDATLTFPQTIVLRYGSLEPPERRLPQAAADYKRWTLARMRAFETVMAGAEYACAGRFTMADISIGYALMLANVIGFGDETPESLRHYLDRLAARPAFLRAKQAQSENSAAVETGRSA